MTQVWDGISLAPVGALRLMGVARRLSVVAAMFVIAALVTGMTGTSYAQTDVKTKKDAHHHKGAVLTDSVTVTNYGSAFAGSVATFAAGRGPGDAPRLLIKGTNTLLGSGTGPAGVSVSSDPTDAHTAVSIPIDLLDLTGFGGFPNTTACTGAGAPVPCCTGFHTGVCGPGTGFAEIFSPGANKNSVPESLIGTRNVTLGAFNTSGVNTPQAIAFEDPFDGINPGHDIVAIGNTLPISFGPVDADLACAAFGGFTVGTITEFDTKTLNVGSPGFNDGAAPFNNSPVCTDPCVATNTCPPNPPGTSVCPAPAVGNATIGGCDTFLLGPIGLAFDQFGFLFAVNEAGVATGGPGFVTVYLPGAFGDSFPFAIVGLVPPTPIGTFVNPAKVTVLSPDSDFFDDIMFVTDVGDNSIKVFQPFTNGCEAAPNFFCAGTELGVIHGGSTKLKRPEGVAINAENDTLYVVNNLSNTLEMFSDIESDEGGGNIPPTLIVQGRNTKLDFPVDVALPAFTPTPMPTSTEVGDR